MALARGTISVEGWWQGQYEKGHVLIYLSHILPGQITCYSPSKILLPRRQITRRKLCFYYTCEFGVISIKYVIRYVILWQTFMLLLQVISGDIYEWTQKWLYEKDALARESTLCVAGALIGRLWQIQNLYHWPQSKLERKSKTEKGEFLYPRVTNITPGRHKQKGLNLLFLTF